MYSLKRENGIEPQWPTGPIIAQSGKKKNVANIHDVNTKDKKHLYRNEILLTY